ncbi:hypothetical protein KEM48_001016 [Puccinia striiformis f. sp. tritici PST-130]|nr:hypothetical protein KEM48_001016 [Puccinia striiformis f. sp. tritici PST-130]
MDNKNLEAPDSMPTMADKHDKRHVRCSWQNSKHMSGGRKARYKQSFHSTEAGFPDRCIVRVWGRLLVYKNRQPEQPIFEVQRKQPQNPTTTPSRDID